MKEGYNIFYTGVNYFLIFNSASINGHHSQKTAAARRLLFFHNLICPMEIVCWKEERIMERFFYPSLKLNIKPKMLIIIEHIENIIVMIIIG